ncbi:MAG: 3-hydroxyacyl-CoA dehydrogenase NAD-binding domain-containing protein, partial [Thalassobaculaceae bacterium]
MAEVEIRRAALLGTGVIGAGWAARLIHHGVAVTAYDPDPAAEARLRRGLDGAVAALARLTEGSPSTAGHLDFTTDLTAAVADADLIQENAPERLDLKKELLVAAGAAGEPGALIASSTSGYRPSQLQDGVAHPERVLVAHPFNPVYLLPLVEVVGGAATDPATVARAADFSRRIGMHPLIVRREIDGHLSDRLQEALWRENLHLVADGVATTGELDDAIVDARFDRDVHVIVLTGAGEKFFCAGADIEMLER